MSIWTPAREAQLIDLWNAGNSAALIAWQFDTTPNAVIGKVHRLRKAGVAMRTDKPTKHLAQDSSLSASDNRIQGGLRSVASNDRLGPESAHPPAQKTVQTVGQLPSGQPESSAQNAVVPQERSLEKVAAPEGPFIPGKRCPSSDAAAKSPVSRQLADHPPTPVTLDALRANQCHFPIWPHKALPNHHLYGVRCGGPVVPDLQQSGLCHAPGYCAHHKSICESPRLNKSRGNRLAQGQARAAKHRETLAGGPLR